MALWLDKACCFELASVIVVLLTSTLPTLANFAAGARADGKALSEVTVCCTRMRQFVTALRSAIIYIFLNVERHPCQRNARNSGTSPDQQGSLESTKDDVAASSMMRHSRLALILHLISKAVSQSIPHARHYIAPEASPTSLNFGPFGSPLYGLEPCLHRAPSHQPPAPFRRSRRFRQCPENRHGAVLRAGH